MCLRPFSQPNSPIIEVYIYIHQKHEVPQQSGDEISFRLAKKKLEAMCGESYESTRIDFECSGETVALLF